MIVAVCLEDMVLCTAEEGRRERGRLGRGGGSEGGKRGGGREMFGNVVLCRDQNITTWVLHGP